MNNSTDKWPVNAKLIRSMTDVPSQTVNTNFASFREVIMFEDLLVFNPIVNLKEPVVVSLGSTDADINTDTNVNTYSNTNTNIRTINLIGNDYMVSNPGIYNIIKASSAWDTVTLSPAINNLSIIVIINETNDLLNVNSMLLMYNNTFAPNGEVTLQLPVHTMGQFTMIRTPQGNNYWQAIIN
jgi:hypothetical protein